MPPFIYYPIPAFTAKMAKIEKHDPPGHTRILGVIDRLLNNPSDADGWMHGGQHGRLKENRPCQALHSEPGLLSAKEMMELRHQIHPWSNATGEEDVDE